MTWFPLDTGVPGSQFCHFHSKSIATPCLVRGPQQGPNCGPHAPHWGICTNRDFSFLAPAPLEAPGRQHFPDPGSRDVALSPWEDLTSKRMDFHPAGAGPAFLAGAQASTKQEGDSCRTCGSGQRDRRSLWRQNHRPGRAGATCGNQGHTDPEGE